MGFFKTDRELYDILGSLFEYGKTDENISKRLRQSSMVIKLNYEDPAACIVIDTTKDPICWHAGDPGLKPDVELSMKADVAHRFWMGRLNLVVALAKREIVAKGSITKIMGFLPVLQPMYKRYQEILKSKGRTDLLESV